MKSRPHQALSLLAAMVAALGALAAVPHPARGSEPAAEPVPGPRYVSLGDSYSAGSGNLPFSPGVTPLCAQSTKNFAHVVAKRLRATLTDVSCGGAQTKDFFQVQYPGVPPQLKALGPDTELVTLTIGGNDAGTLFLAAAACASVGVATLGNGNPCERTYRDTFVRRVDTIVAPNVRAALTAVRRGAPHAEVVVVGYPWIMPATRGCFPRLPVAAGDIPYLRALQAHLNAVIQSAAEATGARFADMADRSEGRDACAPATKRWIEPIVGATSPALIHPNEAGERAMADAAIDAFG